jgi:hypothetical protein
VQPIGNQGLLRLDPATDQVTAWTIPIEGSRPFRVVAETADSIWFTEFATVTNSIAQLVPSTNTLYEYRIPTPDSYPTDLVAQADTVWFAEYGGNRIGRLEPALAAPQTTVLVPQTFTAGRTTFTISPTSYTITPQVTSTSPETTSVSATETGGFSEWYLWLHGSSPRSVALEADSLLWFTEEFGNYIGRLELPPLDHAVFLPCILRAH